MGACIEGGKSGLVIGRVWYSTLEGVLSKRTLDKEESIPTKDCATAGTRAARVPQSERAFDATQQSDERVIADCILASTRATHGNTHNTRPFTSNFWQSTYLPPTRLALNACHVLASRAVANLSLQRINQRQPSPSQCPKSNISFREFCTHALPASPKQPTTTSFHPRARHCRRCIACSPSPSPHCPQSRIHEVVLPASASRAYHLQPRLSNDRRRNALAPGAFI